jgi:hypothetical protein
MKKRPKFSENIVSKKESFYVYRTESNLFTQRSFLKKRKLRSTTLKAVALCFRLRVLFTCECKTNTGKK